MMVIIVGPTPLQQVTSPTLPPPAICCFGHIREMKVNAFMWMYSLIRTQCCSIQVQIATNRQEFPPFYITVKGAQCASPWYLTPMWQKTRGTHAHLQLDRTTFCASKWIHSHECIHFHFPNPPRTTSGSLSLGGWLRDTVHVEGISSKCLPLHTHQAGRLNPKT